MEIEKVRPFLYRASQPETDEDFKQIVGTLGIKHVFDLENEAGEGPWEIGKGEQWGLDIQNIPMSGFWSPNAGDVMRVMVGVRTNTACGETTLVHCKHGWDRTGLIIGMIREREGWTKWEAWKEMLAKGFHPALLGLTWYYWTH